MTKAKSSSGRVLYNPDRLSQIAQEAARKNSLFSLNDRIGLVHDVFALAKAGHAEISTALDLVNNLRKEEEECMLAISLVCCEVLNFFLVLVWQGMKDKVNELVGVWWEDEHIHELFCHFRRVRILFFKALMYEVDFFSIDRCTVRSLRSSGMTTRTMNPRASSN